MTKYNSQSSFYNPKLLNKEKYNSYQKKLNNELIEAVLAEDPSKVKKLINQGADPRLTFYCFSGEHTLLSVAVEKQNTSLVKFLIDNGVPVDVVHGSDQHTSLDRAVYFNDIPTAELLLKENANPNLIDKHGWSPMSHTNNIEMRELLIKYNGDANATYRYGKNLPLYKPTDIDNTKTAKKSVENNNKLDTPCDLEKNTSSSSAINNIEIVKGMVENNDNLAMFAVADNYNGDIISFIKEHSTFIFQTVKHSFGHNPLTTIKNFCRMDLILKTVKIKMILIALF